jgi:DNA-binding NarL/FixJ family response regulator
MIELIVDRVFLPVISSCTSLSRKAALLVFPATATWARFIYGRLFSSLLLSYSASLRDCPVWLMPGMLGLELAKKARMIRPDIHVFLVTGHDGLVSEAEAKTAGIKEILVKPLTQAELEAAIQRILG